MKKAILIILTLIITSFNGKYKFISGNYNELNVAINPINQMITGYYNSATGYDETTDKPKFTCVFYFEGKLENDVAKIKSYHPLYNYSVIHGELRILKDSNFTIKLNDEHGGCWNVQPFNKWPVNFNLAQQKKWKEIRYVEAEKSNFYEKSEDSSLRSSYLVKGDVIYIDKIEGNRVFCHYLASIKPTSGWIKLETLNKL